MNTLKKTCVTNKRILGIAIIAVGLIVLLWRGLNFYKFFDIQKITVNSDLSKLEGKIVEYTFDKYIDVYEDITDSKNNPKYTGYVMYEGDIDKLDGIVFGLWRETSYDSEMKAMNDKYSNALKKKDDSLKPAPVTVKGVLVAMDSVDKGYMQEVEKYYSDYGYKFNVKYYYILENFTDAKAKYGFVEVYIFMGIFGVAFVIGLVILLTAGIGWDSKLKTFGTMNGITREQMEMDVQGGTFFDKGGKVVGNRAFYYCANKVNALRMDNICWGYHHYRSGRNPISEMVLCDISGKITRITCTEPNARDILNCMAKKFPWIIAGYKTEWENLYKKNLDEFLRLHYYEGKQAAGDPTVASSYVDDFDEYNRKQDELAKAQQSQQPQPEAQPEQTMFSATFGASSNEKAQETQQPEQQSAPTQEKKSNSFEDFASWSSKQNNDDNNN